MDHVSDRVVYDSGWDTLPIRIIGENDSVSTSYFSRVPNKFLCPVLSQTQPKLRSVGLSSQN